MKIGDEVKIIKFTDVDRLSNQQKKTLNKIGIVVGFEFVLDLLIIVKFPNGKLFHYYKEELKII